MGEKQDEQDESEKKGKAPPRRIDPELESYVAYDERLTDPQQKVRLMTNESDKQEQPQPEKPVPPRQDDPLLGDYAQKGDKPNRETKQK